jgi:hypothetical protein
MNAFPDKFEQQARRKVFRSPMRFSEHQNRILNELFRSNGGPSGCAGKFAALHHPRIPARYVKIGGTAGASKHPVPLQVDLIRPDQLYWKDGKVFCRPDVPDAGVSGSALTNGDRDK